LGTSFHQQKLKFENLALFSGSLNQFYRFQDRAKMSAWVLELLIKAKPRPHGIREPRQFRREKIVWQGRKVTFPYRKAISPYRKMASSYVFDHADPVACQSRQGGAAAQQRGPAGMEFCQPTG
jgi:hypothetical protein